MVPPLRPRRVDLVHLGASLDAPDDAARGLCGSLATLSTSPVLEEKLLDGTGRVPACR